jgi:hypothetical protein
MQKYSANIYYKNLAIEMAKGGFLDFLKSQLTKSQLANPKPNSILYNRVLLYVMVFVALVQLYSYGVSGQFTFLMVFVLVGFLTTFFSKNMVVILVISVVFTALVQAGMSNRRYEGMEGQDNKEGNTEKPKTDDASAQSDSAPPAGGADAKPAATPEGGAAKPETPEEKANKDKAEKTLEGLYVDGKELEKVQEKIIQGFSNIAPYMDQAQNLVGKMEDKANTLTSLGFSSVNK